MKGMSFFFYKGEGPQTQNMPISDSDRRDHFLFDELLHAFHKLVSIPYPNPHLIIKSDQLN
jgi:hypothetical protein